MSPASEPEASVSELDPTTRPDLLEQLLAHLPLADREVHRQALWESVQARPKDFLLLAAGSSTSSPAAALAQVFPGRSATVWPPAIPGDQPCGDQWLAAASAVLSALCAALAKRQVTIAQVLRPTVPPALRGALTSSGFRHFAELLYLAYDVEFACHERPASGDIEFETFEPSQTARLEAIIAATYCETHDCPSLNGRRSIGDVLADYAANAPSASQHWLLVRQAGRDVGCLLLADHPRHGNLELVYVGIVPAARGRRFGEACVRQAQRLAASLGRERVVLAVDADNTPALEVYAQCGFVEVQRRSLFAAFLSGGE